MRIRTLSAVLLILGPVASSPALDMPAHAVGQKLTTSQARALRQAFVRREVQPWRSAPDVSTLKDHADAALIEYGIQVLDRTVATIGPRVKAESQRYAANNLNCSSCHLKGTDGLPGTKPFAIPFNNVMNDYPNFRARSMTIGSAADRVNGCMTRSMGNGRPLPVESREMRAVLAYFTWLATGTQQGKAMRGVGLASVALPGRRADPSRGAEVYQMFCMSCHGKEATGLRSPQFQQAGGYTFPPLAGDDSFNDGAGMSRLMTATRFIHANMPLGASVDKPVLSVEQAYDVAAWIESLPRPQHPHREQDFPDPAFRPRDYAVPEYFKGDAAALDKARYGPYRSVP
jgi:thiosulfate dehydrogenase